MKKILLYIFIISFPIQSFTQEIEVEQKEDSRLSFGVMPFFFGGQPNGGIGLEGNSSYSVFKNLKIMAFTRLRQSMGNYDGKTQNSFYWFGISGGVKVELKIKSSARGSLALNVNGGYEESLSQSYKSPGLTYGAGLTFYLPRIKRMDNSFNIGVNLEKNNFWRGYSPPENSKRLFQENAYYLYLGWCFQFYKSSKYE